VWGTGDWPAPCSVGDESMVIVPVRPDRRLPDIGAAGSCLRGTSSHKKKAPQGGGPEMIHIVVERTNRLARARAYRLRRRGPGSGRSCSTSRQNAAWLAHYMPQLRHPTCGCSGRVLHRGQSWRCQRVSGGQVLGRDTPRRWPGCRLAGLPDRFGGGAEQT
jgi:hypothetical protein